MFAVNGVLLGTCSAMLSPCLVSNSTSAWAAGNLLVFGEYILLAANVEPTRWTLRLVGFACITFAFLIHGVALRWGLRLQKFLGIFKILVLVFVIITGFVALGGHMKLPKPNNLTTVSALSFYLSLYNVCRFPSRENLI